MGLMSRKPTSNEVEKATQWGANDLYDDFAILINGLGKKCKTCKRVTWNKYLEDDTCPDCR
jgi:hypothetical protein